MNTSKPYGGALKDWSIQTLDERDGVTVQIIWGTVYDDSRGYFKDGTYIHTSRVVSIEYNDEGDAHLETLNTRYDLIGRANFQVEPKGNFALENFKETP